MVDVGHELELARLHRERQHDERERETTRREEETTNGNDTDFLNFMDYYNPAIRHWSTTSPPKLALWTCSAATPPLRRASN